MHKTRLASADIYRGFVMLLMMAEVLNFEAVSEILPNSTFWSLMSFNQSHVPWVGCSLHDLIQPSFTFLVGLVAPFSMQSRLQSGLSNHQIWWHAVKRSFILIALGIFLRSQHSSQTYYTFEDTLSQIGLGYILLVWVATWTIRNQIFAFFFILFAYWLAFVIYPVNPNFDYNSVGVDTKWSALKTGFEAHWNKNSNLAWAFDTWFLNVFPTAKTFIYNGGGYATLSFIPTLATMISGLFAYRTLSNNDGHISKIKQLLYLGIGFIAVSLVIHFVGICPIVKRIWTPNWVLFSSGCCYIILVCFYYLVDVQGHKKPFFILKIIGINSIAAYVFAHTIDAYISKSLFIHFGEKYNEIMGIPYKTLVHGFLILLFEWLVLYWMYVKKIFIRI